MLSIKTIIFDIGGVLINIHPEKTLNFFEDVTEWSINQLQESIIWDIYYQYEIGKLDDSQFYDSINNLFPEDKKILSETSGMDGNFYWENRLKW